MATGKFNSAGRILATLTVTLTVGVLGALAGCAARTSAVQPPNTATRTATCPQNPDGAPVAGNGPAGAGPLIRRGASTAVICQYPVKLGSKAAGIPRRIVLAGAGADGLAALFDGARHVPSAPGCAGFPFRQLIIFGYRSGADVTASVRFGVCSASAGVVSAAGRSAVFGPPFSDDLFFYTAARAPKSAVAPDVAGLSAAAAARVATRHGYTLLVDGAALDTAVPLGTVIFQSLPPGTASAVPGTQLAVILAVPAAPACTTGQLALAFRGTGFGAGNDMGSIVLRDTGATPCTLAGTVTATGLDAAGRAVTGTVRSTFAAPGVLSPHAAPIPYNSSPAPGELAYAWPLSAEYRDGPANVNGGMCQPLWVVPATWRVTAGGATFDVPNADPRNPERYAPGGGLITCQGRLNQPGQPAYLIY
jgi:hypothetical protein